MTQTIEQPQPQSIIRFDPSQRRFFDDPARVIVVNFHRQKGKDFTAASKAIDQGIKTGQDWFIVGLTQAQADETFAKCKKIIGAFKKLLKRKFGTDEVSEEGERFTDYDREIDQAFECTARILRLPNGARIVSLPGKNPDSLAGRTGNLILTEFGLYPKGGYDHWGTLFPITTRGGYRLLIISTPRGKNTKFYELFSNAGGFYSIHFCDIYRSVFEDRYQLYDAQGHAFPQSTRAEQELAIATFRRIYNDESKWPREYECQFTGDLSTLISWAELERAASLDKPKGFRFVRLDGKRDGDELPVMGDLLGGERCAIGWDVARHGHLSVVVANVLRSGKPSHLALVVAMKDCTFDYMRGVAQRAMESGRGNVGYGDATGLGMESNEKLETKYPARWTAFTFTASGKREVASALKTGFDDGNQTIPSLDEHKQVATDLYAIQKDDTGANLILDETANPLLPESHCDVAYAIGLSRLAASRNAVQPMTSTPRKPVGW
jgi:phage FluMu gp28-like protein